MMGLLKGERILMTYWMDLDPTAYDGVTAVSLQAYAKSTSIGYFALSYESSKSEECIDALREETNSSL